MTNAPLQRVIALPLSVAIGLALYLVVEYGFGTSYDRAAMVIIIATIFVGANKFLRETLKSIFARKFGLDYIALTAIVVAFITGDYLVGGVIVLMLTTGEALEDYASRRARQSLTALVDRIPKQVSVLPGGPESEPVLKNIEEVRVGEVILIRRGEVVPLDGVLESNIGQTDESSLTGEPYFIEKQAGDIMRSGTVNVGDVVHITVTAEDKESTYRKIIQLVQQAEQSNAPLVRLADRYSIVFTIITAVLSVFAYFISGGDINTVLAVLVVATPCPLLLATPIALIGGMAASAKHKIILKDLSSIEVLSRARALVFDKTGTITLGQPTLQNIELLPGADPAMTQQYALAVASAIERNSLHPLAKAFVFAAKEKNVPLMHAENVQEVIGKGISGEVDGVRYVLAKHAEAEQIVIALSIAEGAAEKNIALFSFADQIKLDSKQNLHALRSAGFTMTMLTGDTQTAADNIAKIVGADIDVKANCTPADKLEYVRTLQKQDRVVVMIGDGINDAPALAAADVGIVFSNEQHTAASEAADIVLLGGNFSLVAQVITIARRTIKIALQSIWVGIGLSILCMIAAAFGFIPPIIGSLLQEAIDIIVIVNALRASRA